MGDLSHEMITIPDDMELPKDIKNHLDASIPLLDRQIKRLRKEITRYLEEKLEKESPLNHFETSLFTNNKEEYICSWL